MAKKPENFAKKSDKAILEEAFRLCDLSVKDRVVIDPKLFRPGKTSTLIADYSKAKKAFGYEPKVKYKDLVKIMVEYDKQAEMKNAKSHA